jgi:predicted RecB family endonuclease
LRVKGRRIWKASEALAARLLEELGFRVVGFHVPVLVGDVEVSDIDIVAERGGEKYAVEVKAGAADVSSIRQVYVNATLAGMRPLIVARGYSGEEAEALARRLGVEVILLPDMVAAGTDEVREIVYEAVADALSELLARLLECPPLEAVEWRLIEAIASRGSLTEAARHLGMSVEEAARLLAGVRRKARLRTGRPLALEARLLALCRRLRLPAPSEEVDGHA